MPTLLISTNQVEMSTATSSKNNNLDEFKHDLNELINKLIDNSEKVNT
jgi:hypothetical protein